MNNLRITLCQVDIEWQSKEANLNRYSELISGLKGKTDLVIFPETFTTGFSMDVPELAEEMNGPTVTWMKDQAAKLDVSVVASLLCRDGEKLYNRFVWARPNGTVEHYDKRHLFSFAKEDKHFSVGKERKIITQADWQFMPQVCYDLRFPVFSRNTSKNRYDVLIYVANWPFARASAWKSLLIARAHENQCYVIGVNRVGKDGSGIEYIGGSMTVSPKGEVLSSLEGENEMLQTVVLDKAALDDFREKFRPLDDADEFEIKD